MNHHNFFPIVSLVGIAAILLLSSSAYAMAPISEVVLLNEPQSGNYIPLTINQLDTINNPKALLINNSGTGNALRIVQNGSVGNFSSQDGAFFIENSNNLKTAMRIYTTQSAPTDSLIKIEETSSTNATPVLHIITQGTGGGNAEMRLDSPNPDIELVETDQTAPAGKFEIAVQSDQFQINGRNAANSSFENIIKIERQEDGGTLFPFYTGTQDLGKSSARWNEIFAQYVGSVSAPLLNLFATDITVSGKAHGETAGWVAADGTSCTVICNAADNVWKSQNWSCQGAFEQTGVASTCTATTNARNCVCGLA